MESQRITLQPFFSEEEKVFESDTLLPAEINLDMGRNQDVIVLGRNAVTGLIDKPGKNVHFVSRNHAEILIKDRKLFLKPSSKMKAIVQLNGCACVEEETELKIGDKICLLGAQKFFNFEVCNGANEDDCADRAAASVSEATRAVTEKVLRQYECSICYETMAYAHSLSCGDSFCYSCISDWASKQGACPLCQAAFTLQQAILNKTVNSAIRDTLSGLGAADSERAQEWERRYDEGLQLKKLRAAAAPPSSSSSSAAPTNTIAISNSNTVMAYPVGQTNDHPVPLEILRSAYSSRRAAIHGADLHAHAPGAKRMRRLERQAGRGRAAAFFLDRSDGGPAFHRTSLFPPVPAPLPTPGDAAVVDLTSSFPEEGFAGELGRMSEAFSGGPHSRRFLVGRRAIPATPAASSSSSSVAATATATATAGDGGRDLCMAVYVSEIPAYRTPSVALNCDHCKQSLRASSSSASSGSGFLSSSSERQANSDVAIGIVPVPAPAPNRSQQAWLALCERWVHPTCLRGVNRDRGLRREGPVLYSSLKYTELLSFSARQDLARILLMSA